jgi:outer membrane protein, heavy metal efflux system
LKYRTSMKKGIAIAFAALLVQGGLMAQEAALSLDRIISIAEKNYPGLRQYEALAKSKAELAKGAKSWMPPTVSAGMDRFPYRSGAYNAHGNIPDQSSYMFSVEQMIPGFSRLKAKEQYQSSLTDVEQNSEKYYRLRLITEVKQLFYKRYIAERKQRILEEAGRTLELLINTAQESYPYNQASLSTVFKAKARHEELKNMRIMLESAVAESNIGLNTLMGQPVNISFGIDTSVSIPELPAQDPQGLINRADIKTMESRIRSMELSKTLMGTASAPGFGIKFTHMQMMDMPNTWSVMGMITIPIAPWSSGMYRSEIASMSYEIEAMRQEKNTMLLMSARMSAEKLVMLSNEKRQLENYRSSIIPAYVRNFENALRGYKQNTSDFFVLLDAWEMLLMKRTEAADKEQEVLKLSAEYEFESGILK